MSDILEKNGTLLLFLLKTKIKLYELINNVDQNQIKVFIKYFENEIKTFAWSNSKEKDELTEFISNFKSDFKHINKEEITYEEKVKLIKKLLSINIQNIKLIEQELFPIINTDNKLLIELDDIFTKIRNHQLDNFSARKIQLDLLNEQINEKKYFNDFVKEYKNWINHSLIRLKECIKDIIPKDKEINLNKKQQLIIATIEQLVTELTRIESKDIKYGDDIDNIFKKSVLIVEKFYYSYASLEHKPVFKKPLFIQQKIKKYFEKIINKFKNIFKLSKKTLNSAKNITEEKEKIIRIKKWDYFDDKIKIESNKIESNDNLIKNNKHYLV